MPLPVSLNVLSIAVFLVLLGYVVWRDRENIERHSIVLVRRTKRGIYWLDRVADLSPRLWKHWSNLGVVAGFAGMVAVFFLILHQTLRLFLVGGATPPVGPVLPTVSTVTNPQQAGYLGLPFWHFMISLSVVLVAHELMHGVIARVEGFDVEYVGLIIVGIIPGAFVQPEGQRDFFDSEERGEEGGVWEMGSPLSRLRVLSAGPMANLTVALALFLVLQAAFTGAHGNPELRGFYTHEGMRVVNVSADSPAEAAGLQRGMIVTRIGNLSTLDTAGFREAANKLEPNKTLPVETRNNGTFTVTPVERERQRDNITYNPAPIDRVLPTLEMSFPGTIETYERYNNFISPDDTTYRIGRWQWIKENYDTLDAEASERIQELRSSQTVEETGFMGIVVVPESHVKENLRPYVGPLFTFFQVLFFVAVLNMMIGLANLLPVKGLDGGWMLDAVLKEWVPEKADWLVHHVTVTTIAMVAISFAFLIGKHLL